MMTEGLILGSPLHDLILVQLPPRGLPPGIIILGVGASMYGLRGHRCSGASSQNLAIQL